MEEGGKRVSGEREEESEWRKGRKRVNGGKGGRE